MGPAAPWVHRALRLGRVCVSRPRPLAQGQAPLLKEAPSLKDARMPLVSNAFRDFPPSAELMPMDAMGVGRSRRITDKDSNSSSWRQLYSGTNVWTFVPSGNRCYSDKSTATDDISMVSTKASASKAGLSQSRMGAMRTAGHGAGALPSSSSFSSSSSPSSSFSSSSSLPSGAPPSSSVMSQPSSTKRTVVSTMGTLSSPKRMAMSSSSTKGTVASQLPRTKGMVANQLSSLQRALSSLRVAKRLLKALEFARKIPPLSQAIQRTQSALARRQEAMSIQLQAFWHNNSGLVIGTAMLTSVVLLDRMLLGATSLFVSHPLGFSTHFNCLALSSASVAALGLFLRSRTSINVDRVCDMALARLNTHPGVLDVLGAPISTLSTTHIPFHPTTPATSTKPSTLSTSKSDSSIGHQSDPTSASPSSSTISSASKTAISPGSSTVASSSSEPITSHSGSNAPGRTSAALLLGGGVSFRFGLKESPVLLAVDLPPRSCICVFPAKGAEGSGIVKAVVTKHHGQYTMGLLAVDVQLPAGMGVPALLKGDQQRILVLGNADQFAPYEEVLSGLQGSLVAAASSAPK